LTINSRRHAEVHSWEDRIVLAQQVSAAWEMGAVEITQMDIDDSEPFTAKGTLTVRTFSRYAIAADLEAVPTPSEGDRYWYPNLFFMVFRGSASEAFRLTPRGTSADEVEADALVAQAINAMKTEDIIGESEEIRFVAEYSAAEGRWVVMFSPGSSLIGKTLGRDQGLDESVREFVHSERIEAE
jgi:hypothetical protein